MILINLFLNLNQFPSPNSLACIYSIFLFTFITTYKNIMFSKPWYIIMFLTNYSLSTWAFVFV